MSADSLPRSRSKPFNPLLFWRDVLIGRLWWNGRPVVWAHPLLRWTGMYLVPQTLLLVSAVDYLLGHDSGSSVVQKAVWAALGVPFAATAVNGIAWWRRDRAQERAGQVVADRRTPREAAIVGTFLLVAWIAWVLVEV